MPTIFSHPAAPVALAMGLGRKVVSGRLLIAGVVASALPDLDVLAFRLGIPYAAEWGHRGFSHSLLFAFIVAVIGAGLARSLHATSISAFWFLFVSMASHGILDTFTNGGLGIALLWPWSNQRFFAPWQPIEVAPLSLARFLSAKGLAVLQSEALWIWLPTMALAAIAVVIRRYRTRAG